MLLRELNEKLVQTTNWKVYVSNVSEAYIQAPDFDQVAVPSWKALIGAIEHQFNQLVLKDDKSKSQKYKVVYTDGQPYKTAQDVIDDLAQNKRILVSKEANVHPVWTPEQNLKFRAVHDIYGHFHGLYSFGIRGEIASYNKHVRTLPRAAVPAMFTEVVGQACAYNETGTFQKQKIVVLNQFDFYNVGMMK